MLMFDSGKYDDAEQHLTKCVEMRPDNGEYHYALGKTYLMRAAKDDRLAKAIQQLEVARRLMPENVYVCDYLSVAYTKAQRWNDAANVLRHAIDLAPRQGRNYFRLGQVYHQLGKKKEARRVADYYRRLRKLEVDKDLLQRQAHAHANDATTHTALGDLLLKMRDYAGARREFHRVLDLNAKDAAAHENLATIYGELAQPEEQARQLQIVARLYNKKRPQEEMRE